MFVKDHTRAIVITIVITVIWGVGGGDKKGKETETKSYY